MFDREIRICPQSGYLFRQQKLPAWTPLCTASSTLKIFAFFGILYLPLGGWFLYTALNVQEIVVPYTNCNNCEHEIARASRLPGIRNPYPVCHCEKIFTLTENIAAPVFIYYSLSGFYQNHRRYVKSRDDGQLTHPPSCRGNECGFHSCASTRCESCHPYDRDNVTGILIEPCGAIANSLFNDTFDLRWNGNYQVPVSRRDIAWPTDRSILFRNPKNLSALDWFAKPPNWPKKVTELSPNDPDENGFKYEPLMVWMRVAAFPSFRKLYGRVDHGSHAHSQSQLFLRSLPAGNYTLHISYSKHRSSNSLDFNCPNSMQYKF